MIIANKVPNIDDRLIMIKLYVSLFNKYVDGIILKKTSINETYYIFYKNINIGKYDFFNMVIYLYNTIYIIIYK